jgi:hypothetical protein
LHYAVAVRMRNFTNVRKCNSQLTQLHPELAASETSKFPASSDTWMGNQNDPLGEFVLKRKLDLEVKFCAVYT